jgi:hypothetical protein
VNKRKRLVGLASVAGLVIVGSAQAQVPATAPAPLAPAVGAAAPATPKKTIYTRKTSFRLPVQIRDPRERARLQEVQLYVKNGANGVWIITQKGKPDTDHFDYLVPQDGEYWFRLVTVDGAGKMNPPDISKSEPSLVVVVDTKSPECEVKALLGQPGELVLQCDCKDDNLDPSKTKLEYQAGGSWQPLMPHSTMPNCYQVPELSILKNPVRATACDRAGNTCVREFTVTPQSQGSMSLAPASPPAPAPISPAMASATPVPGTMETVSEKPGDSSMTLVVKSKRVPLEYSFDGTPGRVVVWATPDGGQTWTHLCEDADRVSPVEVELPGEGRYGICLAACAAEGECKPPAKGEAPHCWVEVDCTPPVASILAVRPGTSKDEAGTILITWTASDKNLKSEPIDLYYATHHDGPFLPIAKGLKNDGNYRWHYPSDLSGDIFVRMEVTDKAGNVTRCDGVQPPGEAARPKIKVIGVAPTAVHVTVPSAPTGN